MLILGFFHKKLAKILQKLYDVVRHPCKNAYLIMGITRTIGEFFREGGDDIADFLTDRARDTAMFACELWRQFPDQITGNSSLPTSFARGFMNNLCSQAPNPQLPALDVPDFQGGQCPNVSYTVTVQRFIQRPTNGQISTDDFQTVTAAGPVVGVVVSQGTVDDISYFDGITRPTRVVQMRLVFAGRSFLFINPGFIVENPPANFQNSFMRITSIIRTDGQPDNCGNPEITYAPSAPQPQDLQTNLTINQQDGLDLTIPLVVADSLLSFPINFDLGGIAVELNLGGVEFNFGRRLPDGTPPMLPGGELNPLPAPRDDKNRCIRCAPVLAPDGSPENEEELEEAESLTCDDIENVVFVKLEVNEPPTNIKSQSGNGAPDVFFVGWFEWRANGANMPRQPVHFLTNIFAAPEGIDGFAYTLYNGVTGTATKIFDV